MEAEVSGSSFEQIPQPSVNANGIEITKSPIASANELSQAISNNDAANTTVEKDIPKPTKKTKKKRKSKVPRDCTAPRQPLTGIYFYQRVYIITKI